MLVESVESVPIVLMRLKLTDAGRSSVHLQLVTDLKS